MKIGQTFHEAEGHTTHVLLLASDAESLQRDVVRVLDQVWSGDIAYHEDVHSFADALLEFDVDLETEWRSRGMDDPFVDTKDRLVKDRGDIGEVLGYLREVQIRGISPGDLFAPLLWDKLKGGLTTHGIDGIGFIWGTNMASSHMILCEWKHTAQSDSIRSPCSSASHAWVGLTERKLLQELRRVTRFYQERGDDTKAQQVKWFVYEWLKGSPNVLCVTMLAYPDTIPVSRARQEVSTQLVERCQEDPSNPVGPERHECNLLALSDLEGFVERCYWEFSYGSR